MDKVPLLTRLKPLLRPGVLSGCLALGLLAAPAHASWWNPAWTQRKKLTLDASPTGANLTAPAGAVPVLVRLHDGNFPFASAKGDGSDLRFVAEDDKTPLAYHIEKFDPLLNEAFVWVKVPDLPPGAKTAVWLYFGNASDKTPKAEDYKATYDEHTVLVYHFAEHGQPAFDFSGNGNTAQNPGLPADGSLVGSGLRVDGKTTITIPASASLFWTEGGPLTWTAWVRFGPAQPHAVFFSRRDGAKFFLLGADNGIPFVEVSREGGVLRSPPGAVVAPGGWHHLAALATGEKIALFLDGEPYAEVNAPLPGLNGPTVIGGDGVGGLMRTAGSGFAGEIDELQIARVARPAAALRLAAFAQGSDGAARFIAFGEAEQPSSWLSALKTGYIGVIISSLTVDGWVVIGILALMSMISWCVMVGKALYLNRVGRGNAQFLRQWGHVAGDMAILEKDGAEDAKSMGGRASGAGHRAMAGTPLYRIYQIGVEEIQHRLSADRQTGPAKVLSARSIQAIRATLDGGLVRETQRLNNQMVLLTIAISGGPFLGLLGTVVGVMITFAAVAQAGDVNVNAIAPGIAAALAATVAGLAVAIPALFGYNYLLTRIKGTTTDMHVFIDEFVTKLAEHYSESAD